MLVRKQNSCIEIVLFFNKVPRRLVMFHTETTEMKMQSNAEKKTMAGMKLLNATHADGTRRNC